MMSRDGTQPKSKHNRIGYRLALREKYDVRFLMKLNGLSHGEVTELDARINLARFVIS
jgi:hypothetical protein